MKYTGYLECEKRWIFRLLIFVGGFYGGYALTVRGGVFANAQTANIALFAVNLGTGNFEKAAYYLIPMSAYLVGVIVSEWIPKPLRRFGLMRWDTMLTLLEIMIVIVLGFIPAAAPHQISQVIISFICAMQYNTFRQAEGIPMATVFCTDHLRQFASSLTKWARGDDNARDMGRKAIAHGLMIGCFALGAFSAAVLSRILGVKTIWCALLPLLILFGDLLRADMTKEKKLLEMTPRGH